MKKKFNNLEDAEVYAYFQSVENKNTEYYFYLDYEELKPTYKVSTEFDSWLNSYFYNGKLTQPEYSNWELES